MNSSSEKLSPGWATVLEAAQTAYGIGLSPIPCRRADKKSAGYAHPARSILRGPIAKIVFTETSSIALMGGFGGLIAIDLDEGADKGRALAVKLLGEPIAVILGNRGCKLLYKMAGYEPPAPELEALAETYIEARYAAAETFKVEKRMAREEAADAEELREALKEIKKQEDELYKAEWTAFRDATDAWIDAHDLPRTRPGVKGNGIKLDILSFYHLCVIPPSIHPKSGEPYRWEGAPLTKKRFEAAKPVTFEQVKALCDAVQPPQEKPRRPEGERAARYQGAGEGSALEAVAEMLECIEQGRGEDQGEHINRVRICAALFNEFGHAAKETAREWRKGIEAPPYDKERFEKIWASVSRPHNGPKVGLGTLVVWARDGGWEGKLKPKWRHLTEKEGPLTASPQNTGVFLRWQGLEARLDTFAGAIYLHGGDQPQFFDQNALNKLHCEAGELGFHVAKRTLGDNIKSVASLNRYNSVETYLRSLEYRGPRCETALIDYLGAEDCAYTRAISRLFFAAAVRRIFKPGCKFDYMLILFSEEQGKGKSSFFEILGGEWHTSSLQIGANAQTALIECCGIWIAEASDLAGMRRKEIGQLNDFITRREDRAALKFENAATVRPRQFVMVGTTNDDRPLLDPTGGRRFLIVPVHKAMNPADFERLKAARDAIWADAVRLEKEYGPALILPEEILPLAKDRQEGSRFRSALEETARGEFNRMAFGRVRKDDFYVACGLKLGQVQDYQKRAVETAARACGWYLSENENRRRVGGERARVFERLTPKGGAPLWELEDVYQRAPKLICSVKEFEAEVQTYHMQCELWGMRYGENSNFKNIEGSLCGHFTL